MYRRDILETVQPSDPYKDGRPAVWPDAPEEPVDYVVIGEAPGKNEVKNLKVFSGRSGQLLREMLADAGLDKVHLTNTSLFRPTKGPKDKPPTAVIWKQERPRLLLEISMLKPRAIICVGVTAAEVLCGNVPRMRGMVREVTIHGRTYPVYITHHPAYITYEPDVYRDVVEDFQRAKILEIPERCVASESYYSPGGDSPFVGDTLSVDAESTSTYVPNGRLLVVSATDERGTRIYTPDSLPDFIRALGSYKGAIIGHNSPFDEALLRQSGVPIMFTDDTLLLHYSQDERKGSHRLKVLAPTIARRDTGIDIIWPYTHGSSSDSDDEDTERIAWADIPTEPLARYCGRDSEVTRTLYHSLRSSERHDDRTEQLYRFLQRGQRAFTEGMINGVAVDRERLVVETAKQEEVVAGLIKEFDFNPESQPQTLAAVRAAGYDVDGVSREVLRELEGELPSKLLIFREQNKLLKGFLRPLLQWSEINGRAHPTYKLFGTDSGRTSCADPNLQQVPPELRHLFVASPGHVLIGWDFSAHEVRGIALLSQDERLCQVLRDGLDPHQFVADAVGTDRQTAKHSLFGVAYGAGVPKLVKAHGLRPEVATRIVQEIRKLFPGLGRWSQVVIEQMYEQGYVETPYYHRRRHFLYIDEKTAHHQERVAVNFLSQSLCSDIALDAAISVFEEIKYAPLIYVHDSTVIEVPERKAEKVVGQVREIAGSIYPNSYVQWIPDVKARGQSWAELK